MSEHKNIGEAKLAIMAAVQYVQKTGRFGEEGGESRGPKYKFASEVDLIAAVRPAMIEHGVSVNCVSMVATNEEFRNENTYQGKTSPGKLTSRRIVTCTFRFTHHASSTSEDQCVIGEGTDNGDKASYKAMTGALKYALRQWLVLETGEDPDNTASPQDDEKGAGKKAGNQEKLADAVTKIQACPNLETLAKQEEWAKKQPKAMQAGLTAALAKRKEELLSREAGSHG